MPIKLVECMDWFAPNKPGKLLQYAEHLKKEGVDLEAFWAYTSPAGETKLAAIGKNPEKLRAALQRAGVSPDLSLCFYVTGADKAGALIPAARALAKANINIECSDALAAQGKFAATIWISEKDIPRAKKALKIR